MELQTLTMGDGVSSAVVDFAMFHIIDMSATVSRMLPSPPHLLIVLHADDASPRRCALGAAVCLYACMYLYVLHYFVRR